MQTVNDLVDALNEPIKDIGPDAATWAHVDFGVSGCVRIPDADGDWVEIQALGQDGYATVLPYFVDQVMEWSINHVCEDGDDLGIEIVYVRVQYANDHNPIGDIVAAYKQVSEKAHAIKTQRHIEV